MAKCTQETPNLQLKITAFMPAQAVVNICKLIQEAKNCNEMKYKIVNDFTEFFKNNSMEFTADWTKQLDDNDLQDIYKGLKRIQKLSDFSISQGGPDTLSLTDENILKGHIIDYNIKMSAIVMPETTTSYLPFYDKITDLMGGKAHVVHYENSIMDFFVNLNDAFANVLHSDAR